MKAATPVLIILMARRVQVDINPRSAIHPLMSLQGTSIIPNTDSSSATSRFSTPATV